MDWGSINKIILDYGLKIISSVTVLVIANYFIKFVNNISERIFTKANILPALATLLSDLFRFILWILTFALILNILGFKEISLALGGSIAVIGLGLSKSISSVAGDLISGIFLFLDDDFQVGYLIQTEGIEGKIESLDIRKTKIRDNQGNLHIIPNNKVDSKIIIIENREE